MKKASLFRVAFLFLVLVLSSVARAQTTSLSDLDALRYIASHGDLIEAFGADPVKGRSHYEQWGIKEGRKITFEPSRYMASHADLIQAFKGDELKATTHYIVFGYKERRQTTFSDLDALQYLASYGDLIQAFGSNVLSGIRHYVSFGYQEGRRAFFDALAYIASHGDLIAAFGTDAVAGAKHFINWGYREGRQVIFDALGYLSRHTDLQQAFGSDTVAATKHYINWGFKEGRAYSFAVSVDIAGAGSASTTRAFAGAGERTSITFIPNAGHYLYSVTGCAGALRENIYTTGPLNSACNIRATFKLDQRISVNGIVYERLDTEAYASDFLPTAGLSAASVTLRTRDVSTQTSGVFELKVEPFSKPETDDLRVEAAGYVSGNWPWLDRDTASPQSLGVYRNASVTARRGFVGGIIPHDVGGWYVDTYRDGLFPPTMQRGKDYAGANLVTLVDTIEVTEIDVPSAKVKMAGAPPWPNKFHPNISAREIYTDLTNNARQRNLNLMLMIQIYPDVPVIDSYFKSLPLLSKSSTEFFDAWFSAMKPLVVERAVIARDLRMEYLVIGLNHYFLNSFASYQNWQSLVSAIRSTGYTGKIGVFGGSFDDRQYSHDRADMLKFNSLFDFLGLSFYDIVKPSFDGEMLARAQSRQRMRDDIRRALDRHKDFAQPLMVLMGTPSVFGGAVVPEYIEPCLPCTSIAPSRIKDFQQQADAYQAMFEVINERPVGAGQVMGLLTWGYHYRDDPTRLRSFEDPNLQAYDKSGSVRGKPAESVMKHWVSAFNQ